MSEHQPTQLAAELDELAWKVATLLDDGEDVAAWAITATVERRAGFPGAGERPPNPVIGRRFARAHRALLQCQATLTHPRADPSDENWYAA